MKEKRNKTPLLKNVIMHQRSLRSKRCKIVNFASVKFEQKNTSKKARQIVEAKGTCDLFACLLYLGVKSNLSISNAFSFPLLPVPPCHTHPDGSMRTTNKAVVLDLLKNKLIPLILQLQIHSRRHVSFKITC